MNFSKPQKTFISSLVLIAAISFFALNIGFISAAFFLFVLLLLVHQKIFSKTFASVLLIIFLLSGFYYNAAATDRDNLSELAPSKNITATGRIISLPDKTLSGRTRFFFKVYTIEKNGKTKKIENSKTVVNIYDNKRRFEQLNIGDVIEITGNLNIPFDSQNPSQFSYRNYLKDKKVFTTISSRGENYELKKDRNIFWSFIKNINLTRDKIIKKHSQYLKSPKLELLGSIVFGDNAVGVPDSVTDSFVHSGLLHLLAASGLNVALIFGIWFFLLAKLNINYRVNILSGMAVILVYMLMTGLPPSITRAGIMLELALLAKLIDRKSEAMTLLAVVGAAMLLYNPLYIKDISFQLSFIVTFGLIFCAKLINHKFNLIPLWASSAVLIPIIAQLWVLGFQVFYFNNIALYSVFANIIVLPLVGVISFCGFAGSIISLIPYTSPLCFLLDNAVSPFLSAILLISDTCKKLPHSLEYLHQPSFLDVFLYYTIIFILFLIIQTKFPQKVSKILKYLTAILILTLSFSYSKPAPNDNLDIIFFSVGNADAILIKTPENNYITVDSGNLGFGGYSSGRGVINEYFKDNGIKTLSAMIFTHYDRDHIGGGADIIKFADVKSVIMPKTKCTTSTCRLLFDELDKSSKTKKYIIETSKELVLSNRVKTKIIAPKAKNENDSSLVTYLVHNKFSALLLGDNTKKSFPEIKKHLTQPITILKLGHHGGARTINEEMLNFLNPKLIVISVGQNSYKHPNKKTLEIIEKHKIPVLRTDRNNAVKISSSGKTTNVYTYNPKKKKWELFDTYY